MSSLGLFDALTIPAVFSMLFNVESLFHVLITCFELLYTNMYHIGLLDGAVLHYAFRLEIYGATSVYSLIFQFLQNLSQIMV